MKEHEQSTKTDTADYSGETRDYQIKSLFTSITGYAVEGFDMLMVGFIIAAITLSLHVTPEAAGALVSATLIGTLIGGVVCGILSDHYGRIKVLKWSIALYIVFTTLCYFSVGYTDLLIYRFCIGFTLGGEFGIGMTLVAEAWPGNKRSRVSSYVGLGWQFGVLMAALLPPVLLPHIGWKGMFLVGILPAAVAFFLRSTLKEPNTFLQHHKNKKEKVDIRLLFADTQTTKNSIGIIILCAIHNLGYYGLMIWLPSYLSNQFGYSLTKSSLWTAVTILGMGFGIWLFGQLSDRFGRKPIFIFYQMGAFLMVLFYSTLSDPTALLIAGAFMGLFVNGMLGGYGALISQTYPTQIRATAQNVLFNIGRGVGAMGPIIVGFLAAKYSFNFAIMFLASIYLVDIVATLLLIHENKSHSLK